MRPNHGLIIFLLVILLVLAPLTIFKNFHPKLKKIPSSIPITLFCRVEGKIYHTDLEAYLIGVVAAEMPANFAMEALKAQAIAARTLAVRRLRRFGGKGCQHYPGVDFSDDPNETQAWLSNQGLKEKWGGNEFNDCYRKVYQAVRATTGVIMVYHGQPIDAVFHSTCGVGTADASEVWHYSVPYLTSVSCGFDSHSPRYFNTFIFTWAELNNYFHISEATLKEIQVKKRSSRGRVLMLVAGKYRIRGDDFRKILNLSSTCFTWKRSSVGLIFYCTGYGHGVGMCQYGADGMAKQGWKYSQILLHFYRGIHFCKITE